MEISSTTAPIKTAEAGQALFFLPQRLNHFFPYFQWLKSFSVWTEQSFVKQTSHSLIKGSPCVRPSTLTELFKIQHAWQDWRVKKYQHLVGRARVMELFGCQILCSWVNTFILTRILFWRCVRCIVGNWRKHRRTHLGRKEKQDWVFWLVCGKQCWKDDRNKESEKENRRNKVQL